MDSIQGNVGNLQPTSSIVINNVDEDSNRELSVSIKETISFHNKTDYRHHNNTLNTVPTRNWISLSEKDSADKKILLVSQDYLSSSDSGE